MTPSIQTASPSARFEKQEKKFTVAVYYFGNYHQGEPRHEAQMGKGWNEWDLVKAATPRFSGHQQPKVPLWGHEDESDPKVMERKIAAAADHGIDVFLFDWYHYNDGPFLDRPLDRGFLGAANRNRIQFALMWANHDWIEIFPARRGVPGKLLYPGEVTPANFAKICDHVIEKYFLHPSYWKIEGRPYFSFYDLSKLIAGFPSLAAGRAALDEFRAKTVRAGFPGLHLNAVVWGKTVMPWQETPADPARVVQELGFDSVTSYVWIHHAELPQEQTDFNHVRDEYFRHWDKMKKDFSEPYYPNVSMGWDSTPRTHREDGFGNFGYPFTHVISGNTPERFREALEKTKERLMRESAPHRILNINSWNEWTEGSYLEPDTVHGMKYLEAVRDVFGVTPNKAKKKSSRDAS